MSLVPCREPDAHVPDAGERADVVRPDLYCAVARGGHEGAVVGHSHVQDWGGVRFDDLVGGVGVDV